MPEGFYAPSALDTTLLPIALLAVTVLLVVDVVRSRRPVGERVAWLLAVLLLPPAGAIGWLAYGRRRGATRSAPSTPSGPPVTPAEPARPA